MDRYVGLDAHASSCTLGVVTPGGKRVGSHVVETNARCLIEAVRQIPEARHICLEEGTLLTDQTFDPVTVVAFDADRCIDAEAAVTARRKASGRPAR